MNLVQARPTPRTTPRGRGHRLRYRGTDTSKYRDVRPPGMATLLEQIRTLATLFTEVATTDPLAAVLVLLGVVVMGFSVTAFGLLSVGALLGGIGR